MHGVFARKLTGDSDHAHEVPEPRARIALRVKQDRRH
jgi:hypothetical protein